MEQSRRSNFGTGVDRIEMAFYGKIYVHGQKPQILSTEDKYDTSKKKDTYKALAYDVMFTEIS